MVRDELKDKLREISRSAVWAKLAADRIEELEEKVEMDRQENERIRYVARTRTMGTWTDVRETLPKQIGGAYLCVVPTACYNEGGFIVKAYYVGNGKWTSVDDYPQRVSHWMPLPALPPKEELEGRAAPWC